MLKFVKAFKSCLAVQEPDDIGVGNAHRPNYYPHCLMPHAESHRLYQENASQNEIGPDVVPPLDATRSPVERRRWSSEKPVPPPALLNEGRCLLSSGSIFDAVFDRQNKTGTQHSRRSARIHQRWRIGQKFQRGHNVIIFFMPLGNLGFGCSRNLPRLTRQAGRPC